MPYITKKDRKLYDDTINDIVESLIGVAYEERRILVSKIINSLLVQCYQFPLKYWQHNEIVGMLQCCSLEWQRRHNVDGFFADSDLVDKDSKPPLGVYQPFIEKIADIVKTKRVQTKSGHLNYIITKLGYNAFKADFNETWNVYSDVNGLIEGVLEYWYSKHTSPYEDQKILENGDVV
jgi:hypothetical protein